MGTTESSSIVNSKSSLGGLVVPAFFKSMSRFILAILVVGGSYFGVSEGLRFFTATWHNFIKMQIENDLDGQEFAINDREVIGIKDMSRQQIEKALFLSIDGRLQCDMKIASIQEITK